MTNPPRSPRPARKPLPAVSIRSSSVGRVRFAVPSLAGATELCPIIAGLLAANPQILEAKVSSLTGSVLIRYDRQLPQSVIAQYLTEALANPHPPATQRSSPTSHPPHNPTSLELSKYLLAQVGRHPNQAARALGTTIVERLFEGVPPTLISTSLDIVTRGPASSFARLGIASIPGQLGLLGVVGAVVWVADSFLGYARSVSSARLANSLRQDLRNELYRHFQTLDIAQIESQPPAYWESVFKDDVNQIAGFVEEGTGPIVTIFANAAIVAWQLLRASSVLALIQVLMLPGLFWVSRWLLPLLDEKRAIARTSDRELYSLFRADVGGAAVIASYVREPVEAQRIADLSNAAVVRSEDAARVSAAYVPSIQMVVGAGFLSTIVAGGLLVNQRRLIASQFSLLSFTSLRLMVALAHLGISIDSYQRTLSSLGRVAQFLERTPKILSGPGSLPLAQVKGELTFRNVNFEYEPDRPLFENLDLDFPAGKTIGLVGQTGAGKSTILKLLLRFYDPSSGAIQLDGHDTRTLSLADLRRAIAYVPQQVFLFPGTIRENIAYADPSASLDRVIEAARMAEAHHFIEAMPQGYETHIGNGGRTLSGGQGQRLAIARAFLADTPVLLFDEATSAIDNETEGAIQRSLQQFSAGRTTILVAHRLSTVRNADLIYVLNEGRVTEKGTHESLIAANGIYASFWRVQTGERAPQPSTPELLPVPDEPLAGAVPIFTPEPETLPLDVPADDPEPDPVTLEAQTHDAEAAPLGAEPQEPESTAGPKESAPLPAVRRPAKKKPAKLTKARKKS